MLMPGHKYEFSKTSGETAGTFLYEFFAGPVYTYSTGQFTFRFPVTYYYLGFPVKSSGQYYYSHNEAFFPSVTYRSKRWVYSLRLFMHNTYYSSYYSTEDLRWGYSMLLTTMPGIGYFITDSVALVTSDEIFTGLIEDSEAPSTSGIGFYRKGFTKNKWYIGFDFYPPPLKTVRFQYIYETNFNNGVLIETDHQVYLLMVYLLKLYK